MSARGYILTGEGWELTIWPNGTGGTLSIEKSMEYTTARDQREIPQLALTHAELADIAEFLVYVQEQSK